MMIWWIGKKILKKMLIFISWSKNLIENYKKIFDIIWFWLKYQHRKNQEKTWLF